VLGLKKIDYVSVSTNPSAVVSGKRYITHYNKVFSVIKSVKLQCVSKKNIPDIFSYNSRKHCRILIIFGTRITEKVGNQQML